MMGTLAAAALLGGLGLWGLHNMNSTNTKTDNRTQNKFFTVETSEGEFCRINTSDLSSPFYGSAWTKILTAYEQKDFLRGRVITRSVSRDNRFSGYSVDIEGVEAFLPASKAAWFHAPERDACGKFIALSVENVYTSGAKIGKLVVNAYEPLRFLTSKQDRKTYNPGGLPYAIAVDYNASFLIFPHLRDKVIYVPMQEALRVAQAHKLGNNPENFTGYCWQLRVKGWKGSECLASAVNVLTE